MLLLPFKRLGCGVPSEEYWSKRYQSGEQPHIGQHKKHSFIRHIQWIFQWTDYCIISGERFVVSNVPMTRWLVGRGGNGNGDGGDT